MRLLLAYGALCLLWPSSACKRPEQRLVVTGSSTIAPLLSQIAKRYEAQHPGVRIDVQTGGSSRGVADARQRVADIGMVSRALRPEEQDLRSYTIARDGISIIVHRDNPVASLSRDQLIAIYTGEITSWRAVGGKERPITVVNKAEGRSTLELFLHHFQLKSQQIKAQVVIGDNEQGIKTVSGNPDAIGYVSIGTAEYDARQGVPIRLLPLDGVEASTENLAQGSFPLARPLNLVVPAEPKGLTKAFLDFARSPQVKDIVEQQQFVPLSS